MKRISNIPEDVFFEYFLKREKERRKEALGLFKKLNYNKLHQNYIHYLKTETKEIKLKSNDFFKALDQMNTIKKQLPKNITYVNIFSGSEYDEDSLYISYIEYEIEDESKCSKLAKNWASSAAWEMKYQPDSKKGKSWKKKFDELTAK